MKDQNSKVYSTRYSEAVSHPSTNRARRCLTSGFGREPVYSTWYGRRHQRLRLQPTYSLALTMSECLLTFLSIVSISVQQHVFLYEINKSTSNSDQIVHCSDKITVFLFLGTIINHLGTICFELSSVDSKNLHQILHEKNSYFEQSRFC